MSKESGLQRLTLPHTYHVVSLSIAARIAGAGYIELIEELGRLRIPAIDYDPSELAAELQTLE